MERRGAHHDPGAGRAHRPLARRGQLRAARHAGLGRDRGAGARGRRRSSATRPTRSPAPSPAAPPRSSACSSAASPTSGTRSSCAPSSASSTAPPAARSWPTPTASPRASSSSAERLVAQRVDGLVVVPIGPASGGWASIARQVATVTIGDALPGVEPAGEVIFDNERGVQQSLQHLSDLGHRRVTVLSWAVETSPERQAERAVAATAAALGLECRVVPCAYSLNGSRPLALELLAGDGPPDRGPLHVRLDRLRRLRRVRGARSCRSRATWRSRASATIRSPSCSRLR